MPGSTERIGLGTSILLVSLHNPMHLAKEVATLQELSGEGAECKGRGRRADEAIRMMRALWSGERDLEGEFWSFYDATWQPHPSPQSEIWVGGSSERAQAGTRVGDVWHLSRGSDPEHIRRVKKHIRSYA